MRKTCTFLHVPREGDEKFCMKMVQKFSRSANPVNVQRAVDMFVGYYGVCAPGACFSVQVVSLLLSSLLKLSCLPHIMSILNTLLSHNIRPPPECVLAVYEHVRERQIHNAVPQLINLTSKIVEAGCVFTVDQCEYIQNCLEFLHVPKEQMDIFLSVKFRAQTTSCQPSEVVQIMQAFRDMEVYKQQEDWSGLASVFCRVCVSQCSQSVLLRFCCCVTTVLLKEPKRAHTLPFNAFTDAVFERAPTDALVRGFLGRIGLSLLIRYYRTQQWSKGQKVVEVLSRKGLRYSVLTGLFGLEDAVSRCALITMATEVHLQSGSVEGALNVLRDNEWFVSCSVWSCERADVAYRVRLLTLLAQQTSHRDTLEVLSNLPGLQQPVDGVDVCEYVHMFNSHLRVCMERHALPVAADTLDFMLDHRLSADPSLLQSLLLKLGKQNLWSRARTLFKHALSLGYYPLLDALPGSLVLVLPCSLSDVEMALAFEMFISWNANVIRTHTENTLTLTMVLKRSADGAAVMESVYLSAGCRLLGAARMPNPKLTVHYTTVNQQQEQVFTLDLGSAHRWLTCNQSWALEVWAA
ncbi:protein TOPAZ1 [Denticeps clupeoides]|uniref:protein TOPAZ1 n=1 Tax=Denticeps clupeoides TaxID=299321 RepID=UPI0010A38D52|nr:protein TOPAZ1 [Denticeps clupeoides]